jgi:hypothetical protein
MKKLIGCPQICGTRIFAYIVGHFYVGQDGIPMPLR